jgi:hypothetical protein
VIIEDWKLGIMGFGIFTLGILYLSFANYFIEGMKPHFFYRWKISNDSYLEEAIKEFNMFFGLEIICIGLFCLIGAKHFISPFENLILRVLVGLIFVGSFVFLIYFNLRFFWKK